MASALFVSIAAFWLLTDSAETQTTLTASSASVDGTILTITLSSAADASSTAVATDFTVSAGESSLTIDSASVSGTTITLTLDAVVADPDCDASAITVSYTKSGSSVTGSNAELSDFSELSVTNETDLPPAIASIETDSTGQYIYVNFCENIAAGENGFLTISAFSASINGQNELINNVLIRSGTPSRLEIQFGNRNAISEGDDVTVSYQSDDATDGDPPQDANQGGKQVESWTNRSVTNNVDSPPSLLSVTALWNVITLTYSEALNESSVPDKSAFTIGGRTSPPEIESVAISGDTVTLTVSYVIRGNLSPQFQLSYTSPDDSPLQQADGAKVAPSFSSELVVSSTPTTKPAVTDAEVDGTTLTITFDLPLIAVAPASAFTIDGQSGVTVTNSTFAGSVVTLTLAPAVSSGSTITVSYVMPNGPPRIEGRNIEDAKSFSNQSVTNNTVAPLPEFSSAAVSADGSTLTITFSLALDESADNLPATSTFSLSGTSAQIASVSIDGSTVSLALNPPVDVGETITLCYTAPSDEMAGRLQSDAHAQAVATFSGQAVTNNADGKPRPISAEVDGAILTITFDRHLDASSLPAASSFTLAGTMVTIADRSVDSAELVLTLSPAVNHTEKLAVSYAAPMESPLKRDGKEILVDSFAALRATNVTPNPTPTFRSASIDATGQTLTIVMSHTLLSTTAGAPEAATFTLAGSEQAAIESVTIDGASIELGLSPPADVNEMLTISYQPPTDTTQPALQSTDGLWKTAAWTNQPVTNNTDGKPRLVKATVNGDSLLLTFDRALDSSSTPPSADFSLTPTNVSVTEVGIDDRAVTLALSKAVEHDDAVTVSYTAAGSDKLKRDSLELFVSAFSEFVVVNNTPEPLVLSVVGDGSGIVVSFSVALNTASTPSETAFSLGSDQPAVSLVNVSSMKVTLTLATALKEGADYTLTYTAPQSSPLQQSDLSAIPDFTETVTNNTDVAPKVASVIGDQTTLAIAFDQALDSMANISLSSFSLTGDSDRTVTAHSIDGSTLTLTLSSALKEDELATVRYAKPTQDGIVDPTGNQAESFSKEIVNQTDTAPVPVSGTVEDDKIVIILDQELYADPRFAPLATDSVLYEHFSLTGTEAVISVIEISNEGPGGVGQIVLTLSMAVGEEETILITYQPTGSGNIPIRDNDEGKSRAQIDSYLLKNLTASPPAFVSAKVNRDLLTVTFDRALNPDLEPHAAWFVLEPVTDQDDPPSPVGSNLGVEVLSASITGQSLGLLVSLLVPDEVEYKPFFLNIAPSVPEDVEYELSYKAPATGGLVGESGKAVTGLAQAVEVTNETDYAPTPLNVETDEDGTRVLVTFDQLLKPPDSRDTSWYSLGPALEIDSVDFLSYEHREPQIEITLVPTTPIREGTALILAYTPPLSGGLRDDDGDEGGNLVGAFDEPVENLVDVAPLLESVTANRNMVTLEFDQELDEARVPPTCGELLAMMLQIDDLDCETTEELPWFTVRVDGSRTVPIDAVKIEGTTVRLELRDRVSSTESVTVRYEPTSVGDRNIRDTSTSEPHHAEPFGPIEATNATAAAATSASFDRLRPTMIEVQFDGALPSESSLVSDPLEVIVDSSRVAVQEIKTAGSALMTVLADPVPECSSLAMSYSPADTIWLDAAGHAIEAFSFQLGNFIERSRQLTCVRSDHGGMVLRFSPSAIDSTDVEVEWLMSVNEETRPFVVEESGGVVHLVPLEPICVGDEVEITQSHSDHADDLSLTREIEHAAPCALSAVAVGTSLRVTFDQPLDPSLPISEDFAIEEQALVAAVVAIEGNVLRLQLVPPGVRVEDGVALSYSGDSLQGGGLTVAPFSVAITDQTEPPELTSAYSFGTLIVLKFDQPLLARNVPSARFIPAGVGEDVNVSSVEISGSSVYLHLSTSLPDEPDLFGVVYLARTSGGLAGLTGARVPDTVFLVQNLTENPPSVKTIEVDSKQVVVTFDQRIDGTDAKATDFIVFAGRRRIEVSALEWSRMSVVISLAERVTSLDSVLLVYRPSDDGQVRDLSKIPLAEFEIWAENRTDAPENAEEILEDARLRSSSGGTTFERELTRGFASSAGIQFTVLPGEGQISIAHRQVLLSVDAGRLSSGPLVVHLSSLKDVANALKHVGHIPTSCWTDDEAADVSAWLLGESDLNGVPTDHGVAVSILGLVELEWASTVCVLDLITGNWSYWRPGSEFSSPSLILENVTTVPLSPDPMPLAR